MTDSHITRPAKVWIFGGGITGLSAAHELVERGFEVHVLEAAGDPRWADRPALGGVARTQYGWLPLGAKATAAETPLGAEKPTPRVLPMVRVPVPSLLDGNIEDDGSFALGDDNERAIDAFLDALKVPAAWPDAALRIRVDVTVGANTRDRGEGASRVSAQELAARFGELVRKRLQEKAPRGVAVYAPSARERVTAPAVRGEEIEARLTLLNDGVVPGEHGFRYFPGFYRHLFDTMRRTVVTASVDEKGKRFWKSALDNLATTQATWLVVKNREAPPGDAPDARYNLVSFPRRQPRSVQALVAQVQSFLRDLGYSAADLSRLTLKLFQYMTTSSERRAAEHEDSTWWSFIEGERFTAICRDHMDRGPEVLGAMTARESDTRTQGNCVVQLLVDQILGRELTDATLNGPTTEAWFDLWYEYLRGQGVEFYEEKLVGFRAPEAGEREDVLLPVSHDRDGNRVTRRFTEDADHWFLLALPGAAMMGFKEFSDDARDEGFAERFVDALSALPEDRRGARDDFDRLISWKRRIREEHAGEVARADGDARRVEARGVGPMRHLTGVQYFFHANVQFGQEHTLYMDSPWRLSSISQTHFWGRPALGRQDYRGIVSVDLGALHQPDHDGAQGVTAWESTADDIAFRVWAQVGPSVSVDTLRDRRMPWRESPTPSPVQGPPPPSESARDPSQTAPRGGDRTRRAIHAIPRFGGDTLRPMAYHIDTNLEFERSSGGEGRVVRNRAPYLINRPREFRLRPGALHDDATRTRGYAPQNHRWLMAGTFTQTFTRLTTMEAANESARHAVNAVLHARQVQGDRCMIWDPEECEIPDLLPLREIDRKLFLDGYPHMVEILGLEEIPDALLPDTKLDGVP